MGHRSALIVDDSRTARETLSRMLADHQLRVETAESAEAALEFLATHRPDVIFMDHMMPGMDGFQAVRAIKENPATATIPVMMYTSQSGELYVGQARALGAVGVLPKQIKPVEVTEVLKTLHLLSGDGPAVPLRAEGPNGLPGVESVHAPADWSELHGWLQEMLADHNRALRADLESTVNRALVEHLRSGNPGRRASDRAPRLPWWPAGALILALAALAGVFFWLHLDSEAKWRAVTEQNLGLLATLDARRTLELERASTALAADDRQQSDTVDRSIGVAAALEWGVNQAAAYPLDELPFGDRRREKLAELLTRLRELDFRGTVRLEGHVGDFCMVRAGDSVWRPAPDDLPVERCERIGLAPEDARAESGRQSVGFANFLSAQTLAGGPIRVEVEAMGNSLPRSQYPPEAAGTTAGDWNRAARDNQRVEIKLFADTSAAARNAP